MQLALLLLCACVFASSSSSSSPVVSLDSILYVSSFILLALHISLIIPGERCEHPKEEHFYHNEYLLTLGRCLNEGLPNKQVAVE